MLNYFQIRLQINLNLIIELITKYIYINLLILIICENEEMKSSNNFKLRTNRKIVQPPNPSLEKQLNRDYNIPNQKSFSNDIKIIRQRSNTYRSFSNIYFPENNNSQQLANKTRRKYIRDLNENPIHNRPFSSKIIMKSQANFQKIKSIYNNEKQTLKKQSRLAKEDQQKNRMKQQEQIDNIKNLLERKKQERALQREKEKQLFRQRCLELLHRNQKIKFQEEPNYRLIKEILSQLKVSRTICPPQEAHIKIIETQINMKQSTSSTKFPSSVFQEKSNRNNSSSSVFAKKKFESMVFKTNDYASDKVYKKKINSFLEFLYKVNFSNCIYIQINLKDTVPEIQMKKYKVYIGKGNNSLLIKSLIQRRFWMEILEDQIINYEQINFSWTQLNIPALYNFQEQLLYQQMISGETKKKLSTFKNKKINQKNLNYKIMNKADVVMVENYLANSSYKTSIYPKYQSGLVTNHIPQNYVMGSKKALFHSLFYYFKHCLSKNPFQYIPQTFHIKSLQDQNLKEFMQLANTEKPNKIWILKPGQNTNRGNGINLVFTKDIHSHISKKFLNNKQNNTYIIQSYINRPFLYHNRKFDIRHYMMLTSVNGIIKAFWYQQGYIRTSSIIYNVQDIQNIMMHLTNDAIQKQGESYGLYEQGNKISYVQFQRYLDMLYPSKKYNFQNDIIIKMKQITLQVIRATFMKIDKKRKLNNFELFGLDFMIDNQFKPWLIEINSNPCLQISCPLLERIIPGVVQNTFRIGLDPLFPPPMHYPQKKRYFLSDNILSNLKYELIFDEKVEGQKIRNLYQNCTVPEQFNYHDQQSQQEDYYEDDGKEIDLPN